MLIITAFKTPFGWLNVEFDEHYIFSAYFSKRAIELKSNQTLQSKLIQHELNAYFKNPDHHFQLPLKPQGTPYQHSVWNELLVIPSSQTLTYGELARILQSSPRAIGQACKKNPLVLFIPCHRVVGKNNVGGYMGQNEALCFKESLLLHEHASNFLNKEKTCKDLLLNSRSTDRIWANSNEENSNSLTT